MPVAPLRCAKLYTVVIKVLGCSVPRMFQQVKNPSKINKNPLGTPSVYDCRSSDTQMLYGGFLDIQAYTYVVILWDHLFNAFCQIFDLLVKIPNKLQTDFQDPKHAKSFFGLKYGRIPDNNAS